MCNGLENASLRHVVAEHVIMFWIHHCECTEARLPTGCSQPVAECSKDTKEGPFQQEVGFLCRRLRLSSPSVWANSLRTVLQPETPPIQPFFVSSFFSRGQISIMVLSLSSLFPSFCPLFLHRNLPQVISCISDPILVPASQKNLNFSYEWIWAYLCV